ncbi:MAG: hypothetical protein ACRDBJ_06375 [Plesiomonas shigelloides]
MSEQKVLPQDAYTALTEHEISFIDSAVECAVYTREDEGDGFAHTPIVICTDEKQAEHWRQRVAKWNQLAEALHLSSPKRFPRTSTLMTPIPQVIEGVASCTLSMYSPVSSQAITKEYLLGKLRAQLRYSIDRPRLVARELIASPDAIQKEIDSLEASKETRYRLRRSGYQSVRLFLQMSNGDVLNKHVSHRGMVLYSGDPSKPTAFSMSTAQRNARRSVYDMIKPIQCSAGLVGDIYLQSDIDRATKALRAETAKKKPA